jgi:plasmid maintenance system antidote protein VapI
MEMPPKKSRSKRIPREYLENLGRIVGEIVDRDFGGIQRRAEVGLGISQSHISSLIRAEDRGVGLEVIIRLRNYTKRSIDELLGLPPLRNESKPSPSSEDLDRRIRSALEEALEKRERSSATAAPRPRLPERR